MSQKPPFFFSPGRWLGEGDITFSQSPESLHFYARWIIEEAQEGIVICTQKVELPAASEHLEHQYTFTNFTEGTFTVVIDHQYVGKVEGEGTYSEDEVQWTFDSSENLEGCETFTKQPDGHCHFDARYTSSPENFTTSIAGTLHHSS